MVLRLLILLLVYPVTTAIAASPLRDRHLDGDAINAAHVDLTTGETRTLVIKSEVLLDRLGYSSGVIDGQRPRTYPASAQCVVSRLLWGHAAFTSA